MIKLRKLLTRVLIETVGLSSPRGRIIFFVLISAAIFAMPPRWPVTFSVWHRLGIASPSIGLTRAYRLVLHGDFIHAWQQNKLIYVVILVGGVVLAQDVRTIMHNHTKK